MHKQKWDCIKNNVVKYIVMANMKKVMLILHIHVFQPTFQSDKNDIAWLIQK
jgi:hypothetical protein